MSQLDQLLSYKVGQVVHAASAELDEGKTSPPPRYTESKLISDMENASRFLSGAEEKALIRDDGIGTARTRGPMLAALIRRNLLISKKKGKEYTLVSSDIARNMIAHVPEYLKHIKTTAGWEQLLRRIETGELTESVVINSQKEQITQIIALAKKQYGGQKKP